MHYRILLTLSALMIAFAGYPGMIQATEVRLLAEDEKGVTLELISDPPVWTKSRHTGQDRGFFSIKNTGWIREPGMPRLPVRGCLVALPRDAVPSVRVIERSEPVILPVKKIMRPVPAPSMIPPNQAGIVRTSVPGGKIYEQDAYFPGTCFKTGKSFTLRGNRLLNIHLYPLQYHPLKNRVKFYERIVIRIDFPATQSGPDAQNHDPFDPFIRDTVINFNQARRFSQKDRHGRQQANPHPEGISGAVKLLIEEEGVYRVTYDDLTAIGMDLSGVDPQNLRIFNQGEEIAIAFRQESGYEDGTFDLLDFIAFYGEPVHDDFTLANVYWLMEDQSPGLRMADRDCTVTGGAAIPASYGDLLHFEENHYYFQNIPGGAGLDHWFWDRLEGPGTWTYSFDLPFMHDTTDSCHLKARFQSRTDTAVSNEHHVKLYMNGILIGEALWNDIQPAIIDADFSQSYLSESDNQLRIELVDTGAPSSIIYLDWYELQYQDGLTAENGELTFTIPAGGPYQIEVANFPHVHLKAYDITDPAMPVRIYNADAYEDGGAWTILFEDTPQQDQTYIMLRKSNRKTPARILFDESSNLKGPSNRADYIILAHPAFYSQALRLAAYREACGYEVTAVKTTDVYDEFNHGIKHPRAIKDFLTYAYQNWEAPAPFIVLLLGDANMDYRDYAGTGIEDYLPAHLFETEALGQIPEDNWYACVDGDDPVPDLLIGRISVSSVNEAQRAVDNILLYEENPDTHPWDKRLAMAAGSGAAFETACAALGASLPENYHSRYVFEDDYMTVPEATGAFIEAVNQGRLITAYIGTGTATRWSGDPPLLTLDDLDGLQNEGKLTLMIALTGFSGFYPSWLEPQCMAEAWTLKENRAAVASIATSYMAVLPEDTLFAGELLSYLPPDPVYTLGMIFTWSNIAAYTQLGISPEVLRGRLLFGDPALKLRRSVLKAGQYLQDFGHPDFAASHP